MPKQSEVLAKLAESLESLTDTVHGIEERLVKLENPVDKQPEKKESTSQTENVSVPQEYVDMLAKELNKEFNLRVENEFGLTRFTVLVPKKYSTASESYWEMYKEDPRPSMPVARHEIESAFKQHLEKVFSSFDPTVQALIINDR